MRSAATAHPKAAHATALPSSRRPRTTVVITAFSALALLLASVLQLKHALHWGEDSWQMTEWLINYSGGFIRRGLPGQLIFQFSRATGIHANLIVIAWTYLLYSIALAFFIKKTRTLYPVALILSTVLLGEPAYAYGIVRKDLFCLLLFFLCIAVAYSEWRLPAKFIAVNVLCTIGVLSHESFFFFSVPALCAIFLSSSVRGAVGYPSWLLRLGSFSPAFLALGVASHFHGSVAQARTIDASWHPLWLYIHAPGCCSGKLTAAFDALTWTPHFAFVMAGHVFHEYSHGIWAPVAWIVSIALCFYFLVQFLYSPDADADVNECLRGKTRICAILLFQFIAILPLFFVAVDYGRWMFLWTASSVGLFVFGFDSDIAAFRACRSVASGLVQSKWMSLRPRLWYLLIFGIPVNYWTVDTMVGSSPLGYCIHELEHALKLR